MGLFKSVSNAVGGLVNNLTGATSAQKGAQANQIQLNNMSYQQQKEFAQNAHQWEMQDLLKTGLNPALTAGGSSAGSIAGAGKTGGNAQAVTNGNIMGMISAIMENKDRSEINSANIKESKARTELTTLQAINQALQNENLPKEQEAKLKTMASQITANMATSAEKYSKAELNKIDAETSRTLTMEDIEKLFETYQDKNKTGIEKTKETLKALVKSNLLTGRH